MYPVDSGKLIHRATLQASNLTVDSTGDSHDSWSDIADMWCFVKPVSGREAVNAAQIYPDTSHIVTMRYRTDIHQDDRLLFNGRALNIGAILNVDERNHSLLVYCTERIPPTVTGSLPGYWGTSANATLTALQIQALTTANFTHTSWATTYAFGAGNYKYIALPATYIVTDVRDQATGFQISLANTAPYTSTSAANVFYSVVTVGSVSYRVYRSEFILGAALTFAVS